MPVLAQQSFNPSTLGRPPTNVPAASTSSGRNEVPFQTAEQAWYWTMAALAARRDGCRGGARQVARPCDPDDVIRCLDRLYRHRRIDLQHARVLRVWGERQRAPDAQYPSEQRDAAVWQEALARLAWPLRMKGIVE